MYTNIEVTEKIIGFDMKEYAALGNGFQEVIYQRALTVEPEGMQVPFNRQIEITIHCKERNICERRDALFVQEKIILEVESISNLEIDHLPQAKNYLDAFNVEAGFSMNFGAASLPFNRMENQKFTANPFPQNQ